MANKLDTMDLRQIINLHLDGNSNRKIAELLGINRNTVNHYLSSMKASDLSLKNLQSLSNNDLSELFSPKTTIDNKRFKALMAFFDTMHPQRNHPGFTLLYHYHLTKLRRIILTATPSSPNTTNANTTSLKAL